MRRLHNQLFVSRLDAQLTPVDQIGGALRKQVSSDFVDDNFVRWDENLYASITIFDVKRTHGIFRGRWKVVIEAFLFLLGVCLFVLNISGLFLSLRNPDIYSEPDVFFPDDISLTYTESLDQIDRHPGENDGEYVDRLTSVLNASIAHFWPDDRSQITRYRIRVPVWENYLLWFYPFVAPNLYTKYEYFNYRKALERGVGFCSQQALVETFILNENGIPAKIINLSNEHVVLQAYFGGQWHLVDPDFGVVMPYDIATLHESPSFVRSFYAARGHSGALIEKLVWIYGRDGYFIYPDHRDYKDFQYLTEEYSYIAIWVIPLLFVMPSTWRLVDSWRFRRKG